jgi:hypothetical protein
LQTSLEIETGNKLYIVTHEEMSRSQQTVQVCHAMRQFSHEHVELDQKWFMTSNTLAILKVKNVKELLGLIEKALNSNSNIAFSTFEEPDMNNMLTAVTFAPGKMTENLCKKLQLL